MRIAGTILLLLVMLLSQYARQLGYIGCRIQQYTRNTAPICDCNAVVAQWPVLPLSPAIPLGHTHFTVDEFYVAAHPFQEMPQQTSLTNTPNPSAIIAIADGVYDNEDPPPKVSLFD